VLSVIDAAAPSREAPGEGGDEGGQLLVAVDDVDSLAPDPAGQGEHGPRIAARGDAVEAERLVAVRPDRFLYTSRGAERSENEPEARRIQGTGDAAVVARGRGVVAQQAEHQYRAPFLERRRHCLLTQ
jgi:hypothetical protein